jgi:restriction endonuclease S subunit
MVLSCNNTNTVSFINTGGVELFQISKDKTYDSVYIKDNNSVAVSSGGGDNKCIVIIDIENQKVITQLSTWIRTFMAWLLEVEQYITVQRIKE